MDWNYERDVPPYRAAGRGQGDLKQWAMESGDKLLPLQVKLHLLEVIGWSAAGVVVAVAAGGVGLQVPPELGGPWDLTGQLHAYRERFLQLLPAADGGEKPCPPKMGHYPNDQLG